MKRHILALFICFGILNVSSAETLKDLIQPLVDDHEGQVGVAIKHLGTGETVEINANRAMPTASLIKFPLLVALYDAVEKGKVDLAKPITLREEDKVPGSGILTDNFTSGLQISIYDAARLMIVFSDNTATNLIVDQVGLDATAKMMDALGCPDTKLHSKVYRRDTSIFPERSKQFGLGSTSAADMLRLLEMLDAKKLVSATASAAMEQLMYACDDRTKIVRDLPAGTKVAHKTGAVSNTRTDAGIIDSPGGRIAICVLTHDNEDRSWSDDNAALVLCGRIARAAYDYFNTDSTEKSGPRTLQMGSDGKLVEAVQRTINARLDPSPGLGVDGDFGPNTQRGVMAFQKSCGLPETGVVDAATWKALGTLLTEDAPVADPDVVNAEKNSRQPADDLTGPPLVTCKAWAIMDANTGEILWDAAGSEPLHPASTTKIMTGFLVAEFAARDPSVWEETVTFSQTADETVGSSCRLNAGEQVPVSELLYGLLLPSGNDASVALAEHFGARCTGGTNPPEATNRTKYEAFVASMNQRAQELGMSATHFTNTHGLTNDKHLTSARDLLVLARAAMQLPEFARRTNTVQRGCRVTSETGYARNVIWKNTNRLLKIEGFDGVKTGTTSAAGACLVSRGNRDGRNLMICVLGAACSDSRYTDSRNLYRWAWRQLGL